MASFVLEGVKELIKEIEKLGDIDDVSFQMVDEAAEIMDRELKEAIRMNTQKYGTGTLADSIHHNKPERNAWGIFTSSTARGKDYKKRKPKKVTHAAYAKKDGRYVGHRTSIEGYNVRNHDKLWYLEHGTSRQEPRPFVQKCVNDAEPKVLDKMQEVFDREVGRR